MFPLEGLEVELQCTNEPLGGNILTLRAQFRYRHLKLANLFEVQPRFSLTVLASRNLHLAAPFKGKKGRQVFRQQLVAGTKNRHVLTDVALSGIAHYGCHATNS